MSFAEKLLAASQEASPALRCKVGSIFTSSELTDNDKAALKAALSVPKYIPTRLTNTQLTKLLRAEGFEISLSTLDRHRRGDCVCGSQED